MNRALCLDFGDLIIPREIEDNLGIDTGIVPMLWGDMLMRDHIDSNGIWAETVKILRAKALDRDVQIPDSDFRAYNAPPNLSQFLQDLSIAPAKMSRNFTTP